MRHSPARPVTSRIAARRNERERTTPLSPPDNGDAETIERIAAISSNARATWFVLLGALVFAGVTLLGIEDVDFFSAESSTRLPLIGISVPITAFFLAGAALITALYIYLHLYLELLWTALGRASPRPGGHPLSERVFPWLVSDWALRRRDRKKRARGDERSAVPRALGWLGTAVAIALVWVFGPVVLFYFWWRSMPAHDIRLTVLIGIMLTLALLVAWRSWTTSARLLAGKRPRRMIKLGWAAFAFLGIVLFGISCLRTTWDIVPWLARHYPALFSDPKPLALSRGVPLQIFDKGSREWNVVSWPQSVQIAVEFLRPVRANLRERRLTVQPPNWLPRDQAELEYRAEWAARHKVPFANEFAKIPARKPEEEFQAAWTGLLRAYAGNPSAFAEGAPPTEYAYRQQWADEQDLEPAKPFAKIAARDPEEEFRQPWLTRRKNAIVLLPKPVLQERDLQGAILERAQLPGIDLRRANLMGANLSSAILEDALFEGAELHNANLSGAQLHNAYLGGAQLHNADLSGAQLHNANLRFAELFGKPGEAMQLQSTDLSSANFRRSLLRSVDFKGAIVAAVKGFETGFGDGSVTGLEDAGLRRPDHWCKSALSDHDYFGRYKGWRESFGEPVQEWEKSYRYEAIPYVAGEKC